MRGNTRYICYAFVAFAVSGCATADLEKASQAFAMGLAGGAAIHSYGAGQVVQPTYYQPVAQQPQAPRGFTYYLVGQSSAGQIRHCRYQNGAVQYVSLAHPCPNSTFVAY